MQKSFGASRSLCLAGLAGALCSLGFLAFVSAQQPDAAAGKALIKSAERDANGYLYLPPPKPGVKPDGKVENNGEFQAKMLRFRNDVLKHLRSELPLGPAEQLMVDNYFNLMEFKLLTGTSPEELEQLPKRRFDLFKLYILQIKQTDNHQKVIDLTFNMMQQIVMEEFHPVVRYNAMLIIGELNEQEVVRVGGTPSPQEPYAATLPFIIERIEDAKTTDAVRVAALVGLVRHLEWEPFRSPSKPLPAPVRTSMINALTKLAEMKTPPGKRTTEGQIWMRRRAVECLGLAGAVTSTPQIIAPVEKILKDNAEPLQLRCIAAKALGEMNIPAGQKMDAADLTRTLGQLATLAIKSEFDRLETIDKTADEHNAVYATLGAGGAAGGYPGAVGPGMGGPGVRQPIGEGMAGMQPGGLNDLAPDPKAYRLDPVRRRLRYQLYCVQTGLGYPLDKATATPSVKRNGAQRIATVPAEKKAAEDVLAAVNKLADVIEKQKLDLIQLKTDLKNEAKVLEGVIARATPAPVAPPVDPAAPVAPAKPGDPPAPKPAAPDDDLLGGAAPAKKP